MICFGAKLRVRRGGTGIRSQGTAFSICVPIAHRPCAPIRFGLCISGAAREADNAEIIQLETIHPAPPRPSPPRRLTRASDPGAPQGRALQRRLVSRSDVVVNYASLAVLRSGPQPLYIGYI